jgi:predicted TIM-barrel fold metal-dependent hydrolase
MSRQSTLKLPLAPLDDAEGTAVPASLPLIVDAHVHVFPQAIFATMWQWFERYAWRVRYQLEPAEIIEFMLSQGIGRIVALHYAHMPGIARALNAHMADLCARYPQVIGTATVFPGEKDAPAILEEGFSLGLKGVKLHAHVQCFDMDSEEMQQIYRICETSGKPLVMHVGPEPKNPEYSYGTDIDLICRTDKLEQVLKNHPGLKVCVPHLGADEFEAYHRMLHTYDNLWVDNAMILADYLPVENVPVLDDLPSNRVMYGTDFPNIPYAWDRELKRLCGLGLPDDSLELILGQNALDFFSVSPKESVG